MCNCLRATGFEPAAPIQAHAMTASSLLFAWIRRWTAKGLALLAFLPVTMATFAQELPEYQIKVGFLYNFAVLTDWPQEVGAKLNLCVYGRDPFGPDLDVLNGKKVGVRTLAVQRKSFGESLRSCQIVFVPQRESGLIAGVIETLHDLPVLTVAESSDASHLGVVLNLRMNQGRIGFEVNQGAARRAGLNLSANLLRLALKVLP